MVVQVSNMEIIYLIMVLFIILIIINIILFYKTSKNLIYYISCHEQSDYNKYFNEDVPDYLLRMYDEFKELVNRLVKLRKFVKEDKAFKNLDAYRKEMLLKQLQQMEDYADTLECRIAYEENLLKTNNK